jgi:hypothetical protein
MVAVVFLAGLGALFLVSFLRDRPFHIGRRFVRVDPGDAGWLSVIPMTLCFAALATNYVLLAGNGSWVQGDWRRSTGFVALNLLGILVVAPLVVASALVYGWRRHRRNRQ